MAGQSKKPEFRPEMTEAYSEGYARLSKKAAASGAGIVVFASALVLFADAFAFALMLYKGLNAVYFAVPAALAAVDLLFLLTACLTNFRFRYAKVAVGLYAAVSVALSALFAFLSAAGSEQAMTFFGLGTFFVPHLLLWGALIWASKLAETPKFSKRKWTSSAAMLLLVAGVFLYGAASFTSGTLGQGVSVSGGEKEVVFGYLPDEGFGDGYAAVGVVDGKGDTIRIPDTFHGKPVSAVDCAVFSEEGIKTVYLEGATAKKLNNLDGLGAANDGLKVVAYRQAIDAYATQLFGAAVSGKGAAGEFLCALQPVLAEDEYFVSFRYDFDSLPSDARPIPIYIGKKGTSFEISALGDYAERYEKRADLAWNYQNSEDRSRMTKIADGAGGTPVGKTLIASAENLTIGFERVYRIDRDAGRGFGGTYDRTVYATRTELNDALTVIRKGCALTWDARVPTGVIAGIETETEFGALLDGAAKDAETIKLYANWSVLAPEPTALTTDAAGDRIIYGDTVKLTAKAKTHPLGLFYRLLAPDGSVLREFSDDPAFTLRGLVPKQSGSYTVVCRATDEYDPALFAERSVSVSLAVEKKTLEFDWNEFSDPVYDGTEKTIRPIAATASVGGERLYYEPSVASVKNAGTYEVFARLKDGSEEKYRVSDATGKKTYAVVPKELTVEWNVETIFDDLTQQFNPVPMIYNGRTQQPTVKSLVGVVAGDTPSATVSGGAKNAGTYTARAALLQTEINYVLDETSASAVFTIRKRFVTIAWNASEFTYNGSAQRPSASGVTGAVAGEEAIALSDLAYFDDSGAETAGTTNAGSGYAVTARFRENANYAFEREARQTFSILRAALEVTADDKTKTYDGAAFTDFTASFRGLVGRDTARDVLAPVFGGAAKTAVAFAENGHEITLSGTGNAKFGNYNVTYAAGRLTIAKRVITVAANDQSKIYDRKPFAGFTAAIGGAGLAAGDAIAEVGTITFQGSAVGAINASDSGYTITPIIEASDRGTKFGNYSVTFEDGTLAIARRIATATAVGGEKIYDGAVFAGARIEYGALAEGDSWTEIAALALTGAGTVEIGASASPYPIAPEIAAGTEGVKRGNYDFDFVGGSVLIKKRPLTVSAKSGKTKTYDGKAAAFDASDYEVSGLAATDRIDEVLTVAFGGAGKDAKIAGEHAFTLSLGQAGAKYGNYDATFTGATLTIAKRALTVEAEDKAKTYDGAAFAGFTVTLGGAGLASGDAIAEVGAVTFQGAAVGATGASDTGYAVAPKIEVSDRGAKFGNYALTFVGGSLTIAKRAATLTAVGGEKVYDGAVYPVSVTTENLVDPIETLGAVVFSEGGATAKNAGTYPLAVSIRNPTGTFGNYDMAYVAGSVKIAPRTLTPTVLTDAAFRVTKIYDGTTASGFTFAYGTHFALAGAEIGAEITGAAIASVVYDSPGVVSASRVTLTLGALQTGAGYLSGNYVYAAGGTLEYAAEILKKEAAVVWGNTAFTYNGGVQTPSASAEGISGALALTVSGGAKDAGSYRATASLTDGNYRLTNDSAAFTIAPATVSASWGALRFEYDGGTKQPTVTASGVNGEAVALSIRILMNGTEIAGAIGAGTYRASVSFADPNYTLDSASAEREFTIAPSAVAATWGALSFAYDKEAHVPTVSATGKKGEAVAITVTVTKNGTEVRAVDAGSYRAEAVSANANYTVDTATASKEFTIVPREVSVVWSEIPTVYNGAFQTPVASAVGADGAAISLIVTVAGNASGAKNAGTYPASASIADANYTLNAETVTRTFTIAPASVSVVWTGLNQGYDGTAKLPTAKLTAFEGEKTLPVALTQNGSAISHAVDAGVYAAKATFGDANYIPANSEAAFTISKKKVAAVWSYTGGVSDGQPHAPAIVTEGAPYAGDFNNPVVRYCCADGTEIAADAVVLAGNYRAELVLYDSKNYELTGTEIEFTITEPVPPEVA